MLTRSDTLKQPIYETSRHRGRHADECQRHSGCEYRLKAQPTMWLKFLSTFSGTHVVTPRAYRVQVGVTF